MQKILLQPYKNMKHNTAGISNEHLISIRSLANIIVTYKSTYNKFLQQLVSFVKLILMHPGQE